MGRIEKQKRLIIEQSNKRILGESIIDMDVVLELVKYKFPKINVTDERIKEFENWSDEVSNLMSNEEYADLLKDYIESLMVSQSQPKDNNIKGDIGDLEIDIDNDGDPEHFDIIKKGGINYS